jgi:phosphatidylglycerol:prolipoprotein diacylglycerol transferase
MYLCGFIIGYFLIFAGVKQKKIGWSKDDVADFLFAIAIGIIIGGRTGYVLFYNLSYFLEHPLKILAFWTGGMSFHGGLTGGILSGGYFIVRKKTPFYSIADITAPAIAISLGLGRIGNFINGELYGRVTDLPWGMVFPTGGNLPRHPSQLYEAFLEGPVIFLFLRFLGTKRRPAGVVFWSFIALYGLFRFFVEFFREPDRQLGYVLGPLSMGQLLSFPMFLLGLGMVWRIYKMTNEGKDRCHDPLPIAPPKKQK